MYTYSVNVGNSSSVCFCLCLHTFCLWETTRAVVVVVVIFVVVAGYLATTATRQLRKRESKSHQYLCKVFSGDFLLPLVFIPYRPSSPLLLVNHKHTISTLFEKLSLKREIDSLSMLIELDRQLRDDLCLT